MRPDVFERPGSLTDGGLHNHNDLAFGVPFPEIPQRFRHLIQPILTVNDGSDLSRLAELNERRQMLRSEPNGEYSYLLAFGSSDQRPDQQDLQQRCYGTANVQIASCAHQ